MDLHESDSRHPVFWRDEALPFIEARSVRDGREVCYAKHWHETFSIGLISRGRCNYINRGRAKEASAGSVVLLFPGVVFACFLFCGVSWSYRMRNIDVPWLSEIQSAADVSQSGELVPFAAVATMRPEVYRRLDRLFDLLISPQVEHLEKQSASVVFVEFVQLCFGTSRSIHTVGLPRLARAADFIRQNCTRALRLEDICVAASLSASHLIRAFKAAYGLTPHAYQLNCRIELCRAQLRAGRSIADVASAAGFSDQAHFQRIFKRFVAATPGQYRVLS